MLVYINYPNPIFSVHSDPYCSNIQMHKKEGQRLLQINVNNFESVLQRFENQEFVFKSQHEYNDMWLDISMGSEEEAMDIIRQISSILGSKYKPLGGAKIKKHC